MIHNEWKCKECKCRTLEVSFDYDCHSFEVHDSYGGYLGTVYADDVKASQSMINDLNNGSCPICSHWEDGLGNTCNLNGWSE